MAAKGQENFVRAAKEMMKNTCFNCFIIVIGIILAILGAITNVHRNLY